MADHLQYSDGDIEAYTQHGEWLQELLHLDERSSLREFILSALTKFLIARNELVRDLITLEERLEDRSIEDPDALHAAIRETTDEIERVDRQIECLTGEPESDRVWSIL
jgi:hypothetical protein